MDPPNTNQNVKYVREIKSLNEFIGYFRVESKYIYSYMKFILEDVGLQHDFKTVDRLSLIDSYKLVSEYS
jgi:hypothetical protein